MADSAAEDMERAERLVEQVLLVAPRNPRAHYAKGHLLRAQGRPQEAIPQYETALAYNRNWVFAIFALGDCKFLTGSTEETIPLVEKAIRLSPRDPSIDIWYMVIGRVHLVQSRTDEAILWLEKARGENPAAPMTHGYLASAYALKGEMERAASALVEARRLSPDARYSSIARLKAAGYFGVPKLRALYEATYFTGLRKAGIPQQ
jgi:tetratricopeptide (TPR) repeat protein